jgi:TrmH family RNA methyltransferase
VYAVDRRVAARLTTLETPAALMAVFPVPVAPALGELRARASAAGAVAAAGGAAIAESSAAVAPASGSGPVVYADRLADPGNLGTLVRAAAAFAAALVASPGSVDLFSPKVVRAGMGAVFDLPLYHDVPLAAAVAELGATRVYGLVAHDGRPLADVLDEREASAAADAPVVLVVGAERAGLSDEALAAVTDLVTIPLPGAGVSGTAAGAVESLNAGVAGAIALYELSRRRERAALPKE